VTNRLKWLLLAFLLSITLWGGLMAGGALVMRSFNEQLDLHPTAGVK
jgi:hypothetical protein